MSVKIGEVRAANDDDFRRFKSMCVDNEGWDLNYNKNNVTVWTKSNTTSEFNMLKVCVQRFQWIVTEACSCQVTVQSAIDNLLSSLLSLVSDLIIIMMTSLFFN